MKSSDLLGDSEHRALSDLLVTANHHGFAVPLLVGAVAMRARVPRDERLEASREPDLAVMVESMTAYSDLLDALSADFEVRREGNTLIHRSTRVPIDLVPFGDVEEPRGSVARGSRVLGVDGFREAWHNAEVVSVGAHQVRVPTAPFLIALKLFAWNERRAPKDLADVQRLLRALPEPPSDSDPWADAALIDHMVENRMNAGDLRSWSAIRTMKQHLGSRATASLRSIVEELIADPFPTRAPLRDQLARAGDDVDVQDDEVLHQLRVLTLALAT